MKLLLLALGLQLSSAWSKSAPVVVLETNKGTVEIELNEEKAPLTVANFLKYVDEKFYDGTIFHRVINGFMIQGGGYLQGMQEKKTHPPIKNEASNGLKNEPGTIAMARTQVVDSATSQFFINVSDNQSLNHGPKNPGYAVFGKVTQGMHVVDRIKTVRTGTLHGHRDVPMDPIIIQSIRRKN